MQLESILKVKRLLALITCMCFANLSFGQTITPTDATIVGQIVTYSVQDDVIYSSFNWVADLGTVNSSWRSGITYYAEVSWSNAGTSNLTFYGNGFAIATTTIVVSCSSRVSTPSVTFSAESDACAPRTISYTGTPPTGVTWYWVSSPSGTETDNSTNTYNAYSSSTLYVRARNNTNGCWSSNSASYAASVNPAPASPSNPTVSANICGTKTLTRGTPPSGITWYWQGTTSGGTSTVDANATYTASISGYYYIRAINNTTGCWSLASAGASVNIGNPTDPPTPTTTANACGDQILSVSGTPPTNVTWYWQGTNSGGTSTTYPYTTNYTATISGSYTYYLRAYNSSNGCWSFNSSGVSSTVNQYPQTPAAGLTVSTNTCGAKTVTISGTPPPNEYWHWQGTNSGGTTINSNTTQTVYSSGTNYLRALQSNGCWSISSQSVSVTVNDPPPPSPDPSTTTYSCGPQTLTKNGSPPLNTNWYWQGTNSTGQDYTSPEATGTTYQAPFTNTYYLRARNTLGCWSQTSTSVASTINLIPAPPSVPGVSTNACGAKTLTRGNPGDGSVWYWQDTNSTGASQASSATTYSATVAGTNTYYIRALLGSCWSNTSTGVSATVIYNPAAPTNPVSSTNTCGAKILTKPSPPVDVTYYWQGTSVNGQDASSSVATGSTFEATASNTYYINAKASSADCWSASTPFTVNIDPVEISVSSYDAANPIVQATYRITLTPGFTVPAGSTFNARIVITPECNNFVNWTESTIYNEVGALIGTTRSYYDGLGKSLLNESKDYLSKKVFASQPLYNSYGMAAASTMAAPILEQDFIYKNNFARNASDQPYSANDFDLRTTTNVAGSGEVNYPKPMGEQPGTVGWYYSTSNNLEPLTPVTDYPYARSYTLEGPNPTTTKSAGPGDAHRMGTGHEVISERQLIGASDLTHYLSLRSYFVTSSLPVTGYKFITTDPDGKKAVSFVDADGRGLASATLSGTTFDNWSYSYYNDLGQLVASVAPNGVNTGSTALPQFVTLYKYDHLGRLIETTSADEGTSRFVYSTDGKIRFSQNQEQYNATPQRFSYTNYDYLGRLIESGEYTSSGGYIFQPHSILTAPDPNSVLNIVDVVGQTTGISKKIAAQQSYCSDYIFIEYDKQSIDFPETAPVFQENLDGQVAKTENENSITWYSYDEFSQLTKTWQKIIKSSIANPPVIKTVEYTYDYFGNVTEVAYQKNTAADRFYHHYVYDLNNRLIEVSTSKDGTTKKLQAQYQYYLHGPLKKVILANNLQGIDYTYTIDGSLKTINHADPAKDPGADGTDVFGETLQYFDGDYQGAGYSAGSQTISGYNNQFSGLLKATSWNSPADKNQMRTYAYQYDSRNQLTNAIWGSMTGAAGTYGFSPALLDKHREAANSYDKNGNIESLTRKGKDGNTLANYGYVYEPNTNKLDKVNHNAALLADYTYNSIGQMIKQDEGPSKIFNISYNAYGLVKEVKDNSNQLIQSYHYDDRGDLLQKVLYNAGIPQKYTTYISDVSGNILAVYEQTGTTTLVSQPAEVPVYGSGRIALHKPAINTYFYEVNDHLGNVRAVIGISDTEQKNATMESEVSEEPPFKNIAARRVSFAPPGTGAGNEMVRMNSNFPAGPGISLKVSPGDVVSLSSDAYYEAGVLRDYFVSSSTLVTAIAGMFGGVSGGAGEAGKIYSGINGGFGSLFAGSGGGLPPDPDDNNNAPYAYMTYMVFDVNMIFRYGGYQGVSSAANLAIERLNALPAISIDEPGFVYIFLYNRSESINWVYFDNLFVTHQHSPIVAGGDYYPYGLPMEGREITDEPYRYGYQGQYSEENEQTGWNEFDLRFYDAKIARWISADPYGQYYSPYMAMGNTPHMGVDPDGGLFGLSAGWSALAGAGIGFAVGAGAAVLTRNEDDWWKWGAAGAVVGGAVGYFTGSKEMMGSATKSASGGKVHTNQRPREFRRLKQENFKGILEKEFYVEFPEEDLAGQTLTRKAGSFKFNEKFTKALRFSVRRAADAVFTVERNNRQVFSSRDLRTTPMYKNQGETYTPTVTYTYPGADAGDDIVINSIAPQVRITRRVKGINVSSIHGSGWKIVKRM